MEQWISIHQMGSTEEQPIRYAIEVRLEKVAEKHGQDAARPSQKKLQEQLGHLMTNCYTHHPPALGPININTVNRGEKKGGEARRVVCGRHQVDVIASVQTGDTLYRQTVDNRPGQAYNHVRSTATVSKTHLTTVQYSTVQYSTVQYSTV